MSIACRPDRARLRLGRFGFALALLAAAAPDLGADPGGAHAEPRGGTNPTRIPAPLAPSAEEVCRACPTSPRRVGRHSEFQFTLPIWVPGVSGTFASGSTVVTADRPGVGAGLDLPKVVTEFEFALMGRIDGRIGRWVGLADMFGARIRETADFQVGLLKVDSRVAAYVGRLLVGYRVLASARSCGRGCWDVDLLAGIRAYYAETQLDLPLGLQFDRSRTWVDPLVGVRATWDLPGRVDLRLLADVGGFGIGSDLSWSVQAQAVWCLSQHWLIELGYSWLSVDADLSSADGRFLFDLDFHGPELALTYRF